jgi:hypothetical protein
MARHKFRIGQLVEFLPDKLQVSIPSGTYKITRLLPAAGSDLQYQIKNAAEVFERIARESQLAVHASQ